MTPAPRAVDRVSLGFVALYALAFMGTCLVLIAPLLVTLALKVNSLVGIDAAPRNLSLVTGIGALVAMFGNPLLGRLSDRTTSALGMRRPWMAIGLVGGSAGVLLVAVAPNVAVVLVGLVRRPALLQRAARGAGGGAPRPGAGRPARPGVRRPRCLPAGRIGRRDVRRAAVQRQPGGDVPGAVRDRRSARRTRSPCGSTTGGWPRPTGPRGRRASSSARSTSTRAATPTSRGPSRAASCSSRRTRSW